jgi:hypothetical protein
VPYKVSDTLRTVRKKRLRRRRSRTSRRPLWHRRHGIRRHPTATRQRPSLAWRTPSGRLGNLASYQPASVYFKHTFSLMNSGSLNKLELSRKHKDPVFIQRFLELFAISEFYAACIPAPEFTGSDVFAKAVIPTPTGKRRVDILTSELKISEADARLALLLSPYHSEIEVNLDQTDFESLWGQLTADILGERIRYPWIYGRLLYDRFFDLFPSTTNSLGYKETAAYRRLSLWGIPDREPPDRTFWGSKLCRAQSVAPRSKRPALALLRSVVRSPPSC